VAQSVVNAAQDVAFASYLNDSTISYSNSDNDRDSEDSESKDDMDNDDDDNVVLHGDDYNEDDTDTLNCAKMFDILLLENDEPSVSYRIDWVKGKGAGQNSIEGCPPKPDTTLMTEDEAKEAMIKWEKDWKRGRDKHWRMNRQGIGVDGCSVVDGTIGYTGCTDDTFPTLYFLRGTHSQTRQSCS
jgi:hypothetical protein